MKQGNKLIIYMLMLIITLLWGYAWVLMKDALTYMGPFTFSAFRFGTGAATLLLVVWIMKIALPPKRYWKHLVVIGLLQTSTVFLLVMYALEFVDAGQSSVLLYSMPMWSSLLAVQFLGEKITPAKMTGLLMGIVGLFTIVGWDMWVGQPLEVIVGQLLIIIAAIAWAISNTYYRRTVSGLSQLQVSAWQMFFGTIGITLAALVMEGGDTIIFNATSIYYILFTGVLASALCFTAWFFIISKIDMVTATISTLLVPIFGLTFSSVLLGEEMTVGVLTGSALIIGGIVIATISKNRN
ncbi:DMT family transporter [Salicibibacter halophilus]|uniref:DMT family transporter n=1 Tax=Salicibibacter halophilus TaxID=2502791 RepID=A0A514LET1_9BACI|nr:DMT family transporter [Salicibibacter halophilus]QDI90374.1 DMT family transporter [Salicibibacter halophilus]